LGATGTAVIVEQADVVLNEISLLDTPLFYSVTDGVFVSNGESLATVVANLKELVEQERPINVFVGDLIDQPAGAYIRGAFDVIEAGAVNDLSFIVDGQTYNLKADFSGYFELDKETTTIQILTTGSYQITFKKRK
jgi:hypothetical protein